MCSVLLKLLQQLCLRRPQDVMDFVDLVQLVVSWENREQRDNFKEHAPHAPQVHFVAVVAVSEQAFWSAVPSSRDVLRVRLFAVDAPA